MPNAFSDFYRSNGQDVRGLRLERFYTNPWSIIASATLMNPAMFAPFT